MSAAGFIFEPNSKSMGIDGIGLGELPMSVGKPTETARIEDGDGNPCGGAKLTSTSQPPVASQMMGEVNAGQALEKGGQGILSVRHASGQAEQWGVQIDMSLSDIRLQVDDNGVHGLGLILVDANWLLVSKETSGSFSNCSSSEPKPCRPFSKAHPAAKLLRRKERQSQARRSRAALTALDHCPGRTHGCADNYLIALFKIGERFGPVDFRGRIQQSQPAFNRHATPARLSFESVKSLQTRQAHTIFFLAPLDGASVSSPWRLDIPFSCFVFVCFDASATLETHGIIEHAGCVSGRAILKKFKRFLSFFATPSPLM